MPMTSRDDATLRIGLQHAAIIISDDSEDDRSAAELRLNRQAAKIVQLLGVEAPLARHTLQHCGGHLELAVEAACQLAGAAADAVDMLRPHLPGALLCQAASATSGSGAASSNVAGGRASPVVNVAASSAHATGSSEATPSNAVAGMCSAGFDAASAQVGTEADPHVFADPCPNPKRPRLSSATAPPSFRILGCSMEPDAPQPGLFQHHPLRPEQLRSLHWMMRQEAEGADCESGTYRVRGGLLADRMGFGKTSTTVALISQDPVQLRELGTGGLLRCTEQGQIPCDTTLVHCPAHLVTQWATEFEKFLGAEAVTINTAPDRDR